MTGKIKALDKRVNIVLRETNGLTVVVIATIINLVLSLPMNIIFLIVKPAVYIKLIRDYTFFNFVTVTVIYLATAVFISYYVYIEARMQYKNKKYYYSRDDDSYEKILLFPISLIFSLLILIFFSMTMIFYAYPQVTFSEIYSSLNRENFFVLFLVATVICFAFLQIYYKLTRYALYFFLNIWENVNFEFKDSVDYEINFAKANNTPLNLVVIRFDNLLSLSKRVKMKKKFIFKYAIAQLNSNVRNADMVIPLDYKRGVIGFLSRREVAELEEMLQNEIKPFLEKKLDFKGRSLSIDISYKLVNVTKEEFINNFLELIEVTKEHFI